MYVLSKSFLWDVCMVGFCVFLFQFSVRASVHPYRWVLVKGKNGYCYIFAELISQKRVAELIFLETCRSLVGLAT